MKWIKVEDVLPPPIPEEGYRILMTCGRLVAQGYLEEDIDLLKDQELISILHNEQPNPSLAGSPYKFVIDGQENSPGRPYITHWMRLPLPPQIERELNDVENARTLMLELEAELKDIKDPLTKASILRTLNNIIKGKGFI